MQLRGGEGAAPERRARAARSRFSHGALRLRARAAWRPALPRRRQHLSPPENQRRVVLWRVQRRERTVPCQLRAIILNRSPKSPQASFNVITKLHED